MNKLVRARDWHPSLDVEEVSVSEVSVDAFKGAMRSLAGAVSVITVGQGQNINGMTVSSVSSFSIDPPTMLVSINRNSSSYPLLIKTGIFGINVLAAHQQDVAERFAGNGGLAGVDRFANASWRSGITGVPLLVGAAAALDCIVEDVIERHSHAIIIGRVASVKREDDVGAIVYWNGRYATFPIAI